MIDPASRQDLSEILAIYNEVIRNSTAVYTEEEKLRAKHAAPVGSRPSSPAASQS